MTAAPTLSVAPFSPTLLVPSLLVRSLLVQRNFR